MKLQVPPPGADYVAPCDVEEIRATRPREQWPRTRTYTVAGWDPEALARTIDFVVHGDEGRGRAVDEIFHPIARRLLARCDAVLRIGGASAGADEMVEIARGQGKLSSSGVEQLPAADAQAGAPAPDPGAAAA